MLGLVLDRLDAVKQTGSGRYIARCPSHDDRSPSLSIREGDDGRTLLYCFAGCETADVLAAVGLRFRDVMPERIGQDHAYKPVRNRISARDSLATLDHQSLVVAIIGADFLEHKEIEAETWTRLASAVERINSARAGCAPAKIAR